MFGFADCEMNGGTQAYWEFVAPDNEAGTAAMDSVIAILNETTNKSPKTSILFFILVTLSLPNKLLMAPDWLN